MNKFFVDMEKIDGLCEKRGFSHAQLAKDIGKSGGWFYSVKKRASGSWVYDDDAQSIASALNCTLQDIRQESVEPKFSPVAFNQEARARGELEKLLPQDAYLAANVLEFLASATEQEKNDVRDYIYEVKQYKTSKIDIPANQWWKVIYLYKLSEVVFSHLDSNYSMDYILDQYGKKLDERKISNKAEDFQKRIRCMEDILITATNTERIEEILTEEIQDKERPLGRSKEPVNKQKLAACNCARILVGYLEQTDSDRWVYIQHLKAGAVPRRFYLNLLTRHLSKEDSILSNEG